jgi:hypothetical protein
MLLRICIIGIYQKERICIIGLDRESSMLFILYITDKKKKKISVFSLVLEYHVQFFFPPVSIMINLN